MRPAFRFQLFLLFPQSGKKNKWILNLNWKSVTWIDVDRFCAWEEKSLHYKGQKMHVGTARRRGRWDSRYIQSRFIWILTLHVLLKEEISVAQIWIDPVLPTQAFSLNSRISVQLFSQELLKWELCMIPYLSMELVWRGRDLSMSTTWLSVNTDVLTSCIAKSSA